MSSDDRRQPEPMQGVQRATAVLEYLATGDHPLGPSEISRALNLSKPAVVRILQAWCSLGYVVRTDGHYELGWKILIMANARSEAQEIHRAARRYMSWLSMESGETIHLAVRRDSDVIYVDKIDGNRRIRVHGDIGRAAPLYATASGKAILANLSGELMEVFVSRPLTAWTEHTVTDKERLREDLAQSRTRGYSINHGEWHEQVGGVGAPIFARDGNVEAALSIIYPMTEADPSRVASLGDLVRSAAERLSLQRGWGGVPDAMALGPELVPPIDATRSGTTGDRLEPVG